MSGCSGNSWLNICSRISEPSLTSPALLKAVTRRTGFFTALLILPLLASGGTTNLDALLEGSAELPPVLTIAAIRMIDGTPVRQEFRGQSSAGIARGDPPDDKTLFRVASISKLVTALGFMRLVESGRIDLDADVSKHLGFTLRHPDSEQPITARMLLSHTSSIRDADRYSLPPDQPVSAFFEPKSPYYSEGRHFDPEHPPGANYFHYANLNYGLLGTLIERVSGSRFDHFMQSELLDPLALEASFNLALLDREARGRVATLYQYVEGQWTPRVDNRPDEAEASDLVRVENPDGRDDAQLRSLSGYVIGRNGTVFSPQGGLRISLSGLTRVARLMVNRGVLNGHRLLGAESIELMERTAWQYRAGNGDDYGGLFLSWGLGLQRFTGQATARGGDRLFVGDQGGFLGHLGEAYGLVSGLFYHPRTGEILVYVLNGTASDPAQYPGSYSAFYRWEEVLLTELFSASPASAAH